MGFNLPPDVERKVLELAAPAARPRGSTPPTASAGWAVEFTIDWRPVNESNVRDGARAYIRRKETAKALARRSLPPLLPAPPVRVTLTRLGGQKRMDEPDGLSNSMKVLKDVIADALGVDDGDVSRVRWVCKQRPAYGATRVLVRVESI